MYPPLFYRFIAPNAPQSKEGLAFLAPYHTRRTEAALLNYGYERSQVAVVVPEKIRNFIGPHTRLVSITVRDPQSKIHHYSLLNPFDGDSFSSHAFQDVLRNIARNGYNLKIVVEGPGAWQLARTHLLRKYGINHVIVGEATTDQVSSIMKQIIAGEKVPPVIRPSTTPFRNSPTVYGGVLEGRIEVARGCNRQCRFCNVASVQCRPLKDIIAEAKINAKSRQPNLSFRSDDIFNYGAKSLQVNAKAILKLYKSVKQISGIHRVGQCYLALAAVAANPTLIAELSEIMDLGSANYPITAVLTGIESGSTRLMQELMPGKTRPFKASQWQDVVLESFAIMHDHYWVLTGMFILGLPSEQSEDIETTITLIEKLKSFRSILAPFVFTAKSALCKMRNFNVADLNEYHLQLIEKIFSHNQYWGPQIIKTQLTKQPAIKALWPFISPFITWGIHRTMSKWFAIIRTAMTNQFRNNM